jgi:hypothetical protein
MWRRFFVRSEGSLLNRQSIVVSALLDFPVVVIVGARILEGFDAQKDDWTGNLIRRCKSMNWRPSLCFFEVRGILLDCLL